MAFLDVSEILDDSEFADGCVLIKRTTETVNGRKVTHEERRTITAVLQPASVQDITLITAQIGGGFIGEVLSVWTREPLVCGGQGRDGDLIEFKGSRYSVGQVEDFAPNGNYRRALATRISNA